MINMSDSMKTPLQFQWILERDCPEEILNKLFTPATPGSAGYDMYCMGIHPKTEGSRNWEPIGPEPQGIMIKPGEEVWFGLGVKIALPQGYCGYLYTRSSTHKDLQLSNTVGVIDSDYRGELIARLYNRGKTPLGVSRYERLVQLVIHKLPLMEPVQVNSFETNTTERGDGGFGSTNKVTYPCNLDGKDFSRSGPTAANPVEYWPIHRCEEWFKPEVKEGEISGVKLRNNAVNPETMTNKSDLS